MGHKKNWYWKLIYSSYPLFLRVLEKAKIHNHRQEFLIGNFNNQYAVAELEEYLKEMDYDHGPLSWRDPGEILNLRKLEGDLYQYHIRVFDDGEVRAHFEYASEARPLEHVLESYFEPRHEYFQQLLGDFLADEFNNSRPRDSGIELHFPNVQ
jgi:hypothetical protein